VNVHHLIMGKIVDRISGETLDDTHDERLRQSIAALLLERKGYAPGDIRPRQRLEVRAGRKRALLRIDFTVVLAEYAMMIIKYGPGSLVTRHRSALAAGRILYPHQIPVVVVTNGIEADILSGATGRITGRGLAEIPDKPSLQRLLDDGGFAEIPPDRAERESRILYAYEVDGACACDDDICRLPVQ